MANDGTKTLEKRTIMRALKINEISAVDTPAQEGARALILKRAEPNDVPQTEKRGCDYVDALSGEADGHQHGIRIHRGEDDGIALVVSYAGSNGEQHDHQIVRQGDMWVMGANIGHTHEIDQEAMDQAVAAFMTKGADPETNAAPSAGEPGQEETDMSNENQAAIDELTKRAERAEAIASMTGDVRKHFDGLAKADQDAFLAMDEGARDEVVKAAAEANAVVYKAKDGTEYRKSDDARMVALARQNDLLMDGLAKQAEAAKETEVENIAKSLEHLPGDLDARKALVKSVQAIKDETQRDAAMTALKAQDAALAKAFKAAGSTGAVAPTSGPEQELEELAKAEMEKSGSTYQKAYSKVLGTPKGRELYAESVKN